jgi:hypothetical protein
MIHHAALTSEGVVMVSGVVVYSVQLDYSGVPHTVSTTDQPHQVLTSNPLDFFLFKHLLCGVGGPTFERVDVPCCPTCKSKCGWASTYSFFFLHEWIH